MEVTVKLYGTLRKYLKGQPELQVALEDGATVKQLITSIGVKDEELWMVSVNRTNCDGGRALEDGDRVDVFAPIAGG